MRVMSIDPGGTNGLAMADLGEEPELWKAMEHLGASLETAQVGTPQEDFAALRLFDLVSTFAPDVLVMEDFRLFPDVPHSPDPNGTLPDRIIARIDLLVHLWSEYDIVMAPIGHVSTLRHRVRAPKVYKQMPGERIVISDKWLRDGGLWRTEKRQGGGPDSMDALRHLVVWTRKWCKRKELW